MLPIVVHCPFKPKALVVYPVWAWAIVHGHKPVENRSWRTRHRGPLLIHAAAKSPESRKGDKDARALLAALGVTAPDEVSDGAIVGRVYLDDCCSLSPDAATTDERLSHPLAIGPVCFLLSQPVAFARPVPMRGQQKIFEVDGEGIRVALGEFNQSKPALS